MVEVSIRSELLGPTEMWDNEERKADGLREGRELKIVTHVNICSSL